MTKPYLLFDAGGTLVYPNPEIAVPLCAEHGVKTTAERFMADFYTVIHQLDLELYLETDTTGAPSLESRFFIQSGIEPALAAQLAQEAARRALPNGFWTYSKPVIAEALEQLKAAGYRMSVISNSDGTVAAQLAALGYDRFFEAIFDSGAVGVEKPDPRFFNHALSKLELDPSDCIYIGDIVSIDLFGANGVGMAAVHIDPYGKYTDWPGYHVTGVPDYANQLISGALRMDNPHLHALAGYKKPQLGA
ncbi:MAG TPA: HAD family hydrolase [Firmicutes bacterium]|jgi:HAD superfamily hydrolase (TIGR01662 family)|nr:HAD family hydrolase [Bacillota bacterium]